jgi:hypothetical protein
MNDRERTSHERRTHERISKQIAFFCYVDGQRFDSSSLDVSKGGAFLHTEDRVRKNAPVILLPHEVARKKPKVMIIGRAVRHQMIPIAGVGIRWDKIVSRNGLHEIAELTRVHPEFFPEILPDPGIEYASASLVGYSFKDDNYFIPRLPASAGAAQPGKTRRGRPGGFQHKPLHRPAEVEKTQALARKLDEEDTWEEPHKKGPTSSLKDVTTEYNRKLTEARESPWRSDQSHEAPPGMTGSRPAPEVRVVTDKRPSSAASKSIKKPPSYKRSPLPGPITNLLSYENAQIPVDVPVTITMENRKFPGHIRVLGMNNLFVACDSRNLETIPDDTRVRIGVPIDLHRKSFVVTLVTSLMLVGRDTRTGDDGMALTIVAVEQTSNPGLFERYVKFLYYRMVSKA